MLNTPHFPGQYRRRTPFLKMQLFTSQAADKTETSVWRTSRARFALSLASVSFACFDFPTFPKRSQLFPNNPKRSQMVPKQFPNDFQMIPKWFPILRLMHCPINTRRFSAILRDRRPRFVRAEKLGGKCQDAPGLPGGVSRSQLPTMPKPLPSDDSRPRRGRGRESSEDEVGRVADVAINVSFPWASQGHSKSEIMQRHPMPLA
jgi:hypothetical protein